jgi:hypothetical protein
MSDDGKRWWKVSGLPDSPVYVYERSAVEAREVAGRAYLEAAEVPEEEAHAYFSVLADQARQDNPVGGRPLDD